MNGFLYFIPGPQTVDAAHAKAAGLGDRIDVDRGVNGSAALRNTPSGSEGITVGDASTPGALCRIAPDEQTWKAAPLVDGEVPYWVGYWNGNPPKPADLKRAHQVAGKPVTDLNGLDWLAPTLREWRESDANSPSPIASRVLLPRVCDLNENGNVILGDVIPQYRDIFERSWEVASALWPSHYETEGRMSDSDAIKFAGDLLGVNYRVTFLELALLKSFSIDLTKEVCRIGIDAVGFEHAVGNLASRSATETTSSDCGHERPTTESPTNTPTDQPLAN